MEELSVVCESHISILGPPEVITDGTPLAVELNLHSTFVVSCSAHQSHGEVGRGRVCG